MQRRTLAGSVILCALMVVLLPEALEGGTLTPDRIIPYTGAAISDINVTAADATVVKYKPVAGGAESEIPAAAVKEIGWGDGGQFRLAVSHFNAERYSAALDVIKRCPDTGPREFWYGPYKPILEGMCLVRLKRYAEALPLLDKAITAYPNSFYVIPAIEHSAEAHRALGQFEKAAEVFAKLDPKGNYANLAATEPYGKLWQLRGRIGAAESLVQVPGKQAEAGTVYGALASVCERILAEPPAALRGVLPEIQDIHQRSLVGRAQVLLKGGRLKEAKEWIDEIGNKITSATGRTVLFLALGDLLMEDAKSAPDADKKLRYKEALLAYMRVYIVYPDQKEQARRALLGAGKASQLLDTREDRLRATRLYRELWAEYRGTEEANEARKLLGVLGVTVDDK